MAKIKYILRYFATNYPYKNELSKTRLTKMVYLADWFSAREHRKQLTNIRWYFDHYGPYVVDVYDEAKEDKMLEFRDEYSAFGTPKQTIYLKENISLQKLGLNKLSEEENDILDEVIEETKALNWSEFIDYVYETYPIVSQRRYSHLDLVRLAAEEN